MRTSTCCEVLGKKKYQNEWISANTVNKVQVRKEKKGAINNCRTRAAKATAPGEYTEANRRGHFDELLNRPPPHNPPDIALAEDVNTNSMERRVPREAPKEKRYARMSELQRDNAPISTRKGPQQSHLGQIEDRGGCQAQRPPSWLP